MSRVRNQLSTFRFGSTNLPSAVGSIVIAGLGSRSHPIGDTKMNKILVTVLFMLAAVELHAQPYWLNGKVIAAGSTPSSSDGVRLPAVSVQVLDPENSNPQARVHTWVIVQYPLGSGRPGKIDLPIGATFKAYQAYETGSTYGCLALQYQDKKGRIRTEMHLIVTEL
jgi:hypothetical protein